MCVCSERNIWKSTKQCVYARIVSQWDFRELWFSSLNFSVLACTVFIYIFGFYIKHVCNQKPDKSKQNVGEPICGHLKIVTVSLCSVSRNKITYGKHSLHCLRWAALLDSDKWVQDAL